MPWSPEKLRECELDTVVLVAGMPGAGKSIVSEAAKALGYRIVRMGDIIREIALESSKPLSDEVLGRVSQMIREQYGRDIVARAALHMVCTEEHAGPTLIEGVRSMEEVEFFRRHSRNCIIIAVHSPPRVRYQRLLARGRRDDPRSWEEFRTRDERELAFGLGSVIALADIVLVNHEKQIEDLIAEAKSILGRILLSMHASDARS